MFIKGDMPMRSLNIDVEDVLKVEGLPVLVQEIEAYVLDSPDGRHRATALIVTALKMALQNVGVRLPDLSEKLVVDSNGTAETFVLPRCSPTGYPVQRPQAFSTRMQTSSAEHKPKRKSSDAITASEVAACKDRVQRFVDSIVRYDAAVLVGNWQGFE